MVLGFGFSVKGLVSRFGVLGIGFKDLGLKSQGSGVITQRVELKGRGPKVRAQGLGFRVHVLGFRAEAINPKLQTLTLGP